MRIADESITLRPVDERDEDFLIELYKSSRGDDLRGLGWDEDRINEFLEMQYEAQSKLQDDHERVSDQLVLMNGKPIGRLWVESRADEIRCVDLALLADYRNQGVGTLLIQRLQEQARPADMPLRLQVIRFNRAVNLLERLGFRRVSETGTHFQMEWLPASVGGPANRGRRAGIPRGV
ncbi:MAG TPA: GNAT family N-acetyltransferase, partial [Pyrinomonadaceae bacterium]|nr:GNAT family N-acetyltransferase [Pyrinomonadaceae bacterium]